MKVFRTAMLAIALCAAATSVSSAQQQPEQRGQGGGREMGGMILQGITLTEAQKVQQKAIREKYVPQMMKLRKDAETSGTPIDQAKLGEVRAAQSAELRAILTAEQQVTFDRNAAEMKARMAGRREK
ncbi:MAG: hypothetical protein ABIS15_05010 [Gemmatimonadaceae bacterium]